MSQTVIGVEIYVFYTIDKLFVYENHCHLLKNFKMIFCVVNMHSVDCVGTKYS